MTPKLVIFDCDGVLVDSEPMTCKIIAANLTRHGLPTTLADVESFFLGGTMAAVGDEARRRGAALPDTWLNDIYADIYASLRQGVDLMPDVLPFVDLLDAAGIARAVASNGSREKMEITLTPSGLLARFAGHIYSGHDHVPKPAPDMLLRACADAGVTPDQAVMIDDSPAGCRAAQAAHIRCFGFAPHGEGAALAAVGAQPVRSFAAIASALGLPQLS